MTRSRAGAQAHDGRRCCRPGCRGRRGPDQRRVVPGVLGEGARQFLQPGVVGEAAVVRGRVGGEDGDQAARPRSGRGRRPRSPRPQRQRRRRAAVDHALAQRLAPGSRRSRRRPGSPGGAARSRGPSRTSSPASQRQHLVQRAAVVQRRDGRLHEAWPCRRARAHRSTARRHATAAGASGRPRRGLVAAGPQCTDGADTRQGLREAESRRACRRPDWRPAPAARARGRPRMSSHQFRQAARLAAPRQRLEVRSHGACRRRPGARCSACTAAWLRAARAAAPGDHERLAAPRLQRRRAAAASNARGRRVRREPQRASRVDLLRRQRQAAVGACAEQARRDLRPRTRAAAPRLRALPRPVHRLPHGARAFAEGIGRPARARSARGRSGAPAALRGRTRRARRLARRRPARWRCTGASGLAASAWRARRAARRRVGDVTGPLSSRRPSPPLPSQVAWRGGATCVSKAAHDAIASGPSPSRPSRCSGDLRAVRVPQVQHRGLREDVGGAEAGGMQRIALDLGRPPAVRGHQHAERVAVARHRAGVEQRASRRRAPRACPPRDGCARAAGGCSRRWPAPSTRPSARSASRRRTGGRVRMEVDRLLVGHGRHRWQVEQSVRRRVLSSFMRARQVLRIGIGQARRVHVEQLRRAGAGGGAGSRWHWMHHCICSGCARQVMGIWSTRPWHSTQPTPLATCTLWSKKTKSGQLVHPLPFDRAGPCARSRAAAPAPWRRCRAANGRSGRCGWRAGRRGAASPPWCGSSGSRCRRRPRGACG